MTTGLGCVKHFLAFWSPIFIFGLEKSIGIGCVSVHFSKGTVIFLRIQKSAYNQKQTILVLPWKLNTWSVTIIDSYNFLEKTDTKHSRSWFNLRHFKLVTWQYHFQFDNSITLVNKIEPEWVTDTGPTFWFLYFVYSRLELTLSSTLWTLMVKRKCGTPMQC